MPAMGDSPSSNPFIKQLASSDRTIRDRALTSLRTYLQHAKTLTPLDFLKLWKGLFYCMWMSDKPRNQQQLARDLAGLVDVLRTRENTLGFLEAFWRTMAREWINIDALRMDKYLYLVRCYVGKGFEWLARKGWDQDESLFEEFIQMLESTALNIRDHKISNGIRFHVIDIFVDELDKADTKRNAPVEKLLRPMRILGKQSPMKAIRDRVEEALEDERLSDWKRENVGDKEADAENDEFGGFED